MDRGGRGSGGVYWGGVMGDESVIGIYFMREESIFNLKVHPFRVNSNLMSMLKQLGRLSVSRPFLLIGGGAPLIPLSTGMCKTKQFIWLDHGNFRVSFKLVTSKRSVKPQFYLTQRCFS